MKTREVFFLLLLGVLVGGLLSIRVDAAPVPVHSEQLLQQELKQQQIRATTKRVGEQLEAIIAEFDRNAIIGEDVKVLRAIRSVLGTLSEKDMHLVVQFLNKARSAAEPNASTRQANEAYTRQKAIITQLRQLVLEYQRQQAIYEISLRLKALAQKQSDNMWLGVWLARKTDGRPPNTYDEGQQINWSFQKTEQDAIRDEAQFLFNKLEKLAGDAEDGPSADRSSAAMQQVKVGGVLPALDAASAELKIGKIMSATGSEQRVRDQFREIARLLLLAPDRVDLLKQAIQELDRAIEEQRKVKEDTQELEKDTAAEIETKQAQVVDGTVLIRKDIDNIAPEAAELLKKATETMQDAREVIGSWEDIKKKRDKATTKQDEALTQMQQARSALQEQLARAEQNSVRPENLLAGLQALQEQVRDLIKREEQLKEETAAAEKKDRRSLAAKAAEQGSIRDQTQDAQSQAADLVAAVAHSLGDAASQMQQVQSALADNRNQSTAQQAAIDALQRAGQELSQEIAKLEQAQKDLAKLEALQEKLEHVIQGQQHTQLDTAKQALKPSPESQVTKSLAGKQDQLGKNTAQLQQETSAPAPAAASQLGEAKEHMGTAKSELEKTSPKTAQAKQTEALADLYQARKELQQKIDELRDQLGMPAVDNAQMLSDAAAAIEQALQDVNEARAEMTPSQPGLLDSLVQQQQQIANALAQQNQNAPPSAPLGQAQKSANQAAQQLAQANLPAAINAMKHAQGAMQQAAQSGQPSQQGQQDKQDPKAQIGQTGQQSPPGQSGQPSQNGQPGQQNQQNQNGQQGQSGQPVESTPSVPELSQQQAEVQKATEALFASQQAVPASAMAKASQSLQHAANTVGPLTAGAAGPLPPSAQTALQSAENSLINGAAQASANQNAPAQSSASSAAQSLAQAQAALALAQAGLNADAAAQGQGQPGQQSQQGRSGQPGQPGQQGQGQQGQGQGQAQGQGQGQGTPNQQGNGRQGNWAGAGGADGARRNAAGAGQYTGLPKRDRAAIIQSQGEKYPQEYGPLVEQYLKNLSDRAGEK